MVADAADEPKEASQDICMAADAADVPKEAIQDTCLVADAADEPKDNSIAQPCSPLTSLRARRPSLEAPRQSSPTMASQSSAWTRPKTSSDDPFPSARS